MLETTQFGYLSSTVYMLAVCSGAGRAASAMPAAWACKNKPVTRKAENFQCPATIL